jgi:predicted deacetylase
MDHESLKTLWAIYKVFCSEASKSTNLDASSAPAFLGWLEHRDEIGNSMHLQGYGQGYAEAKKEITKLDN